MTEACCILTGKTHDLILHLCIWGAFNRSGSGSASWVYNIQLKERADFEDIFSLNWLRVTIAIYKSIAERTQTTTFFGQFFPWWFATTDLARKISLAIFPSKKKKYVKHVWSISVFFRYSFLELLCFTSEVIIIWAGYWAKRVITLSYWD